MKTRVIRTSAAMSGSGQKQTLASHLNSDQVWTLFVTEAASKVTTEPRALLNWSVRELASQSGVSQSAIARAEKSDSFLSMQVRNCDRIRQTFEDHGIIFLGTNGVWINRHI